MVIVKFSLDYFVEDVMTTSHSKWVICLCLIFVLSLSLSFAVDGRMALNARANCGWRNVAVRLCDPPGHVNLIEANGQRY